MQPSLRLLPLCLALAALPGPAFAGEPAAPAPGDLARYDRNRDGRLDAAELEAKARDDALAAEAADRKSTRLNSSHLTQSRMPSSA